MKKVTFEIVHVTLTDEQGNDVDTYESIDIIKENGDRFSNIETLDKSILIDDKFVGLCWSASTVKDLLKFLEIEFDEKDSIKKETF